MAERGAIPNVPKARRRALDAVRSLFSPLLPDDYLELINPLWSTQELRDRKSTRLNSRHANISYAVFCLKKKNRLKPISLARLVLIAQSRSFSSAGTTLIGSQFSNGLENLYLDLKTAGRNLPFFVNDTATTEIYTLSLHDALPIWPQVPSGRVSLQKRSPRGRWATVKRQDRKSTRLNSSHANISYAVFCLKKKKNHIRRLHHQKKKQNKQKK